MAPKYLGCKRAVTGAVPARLLAILRPTPSTAYAVIWTYRKEMRRVWATIPPPSRSPATTTINSNRNANTNSCTQSTRSTPTPPPTNNNDNNN